MKQGSNHIPVSCLGHLLFTKRISQPLCQPQVRTGGVLFDMHHAVTAACQRTHSHRHAHALVALRGG